MYFNPQFLLKGTSREKELAWQNKIIYSNLNVKYNRLSQNTKNTKKLILYSSLVKKKLSLQIYLVIGDEIPI